MKLLEKLKLFEAKGWYADFETGKVFSHTGNHIDNRSSGYIICSIGYNLNGKKNTVNVKAHQLIWYLSTGEAPYMIDHINGNKSDNRLSNLRVVNTQKNAFNRIKVKGYNYYKPTDKYKSQIKINGKQIHLGYFETENEARQAYLNAKKIYHKI